MKTAVLDTSFILSCIREKIDFLEYLYLEGFQIAIPKQVIAEIKRIENSNKKLKFRDDAAVAQKLLKSNPFKKIDLKTNYVDAGLLKLARSNPKIAIATLDAEIKRKIGNPKIIIRARKKLEVI